MSYFLSSRDDLFYPRGISTVLESPKFYGNWKTFEKRYTRTAITRRHHLTSHMCVRNVKRELLFTIQKDFFFFLYQFQNFSVDVVFAFFNRPQVRFPLCQLHLMTLSLAKKLQQQRNFSLLLLLSFSHFSPLNFFHYVFVKKAERSYKKVELFFPQSN